MRAERDEAEGRRRDAELARILLRAAQAGDERAFRKLVELHRPALLAHCYRMLGKFGDAEDAFQDTMLRAWRALDSLEQGKNLRAWLYRIATNVCLTAIRSAERRALPVDLGPAMESRGDHSEVPAGDVAWIGPFPDLILDGQSVDSGPAARYEQREAIELAFIAALQHLPARQRAALVLADVLGFSSREIAGFLETTPVAVNSALQRSRETLSQKLPDPSQQANARVIGEHALAEVAERFAMAFEAGDERAIFELLTEDVAFEMPPYRSWSKGRKAVGESWLMPSTTPTGLRFIPTKMNGQLAFGIYATRSDGETFAPAAIDVVTLRGSQVSRVVAFRATEAFPLFGLPSTL